jgi:hypothetical protein
MTPRLGVRAVFAGTLLAVCLAAGAAQAYPQWQFSSGVARCNVCHFSPGGGGLITGYGRDASGDELSTFDGEGAFLYGTVSLPSWLSLGGDFRGAYASQEVQDPDGPARAVFPMQADLEARASLPWGFSAYATGGLRGQVRPDEDLVPLQNYQPISTSRLISREHWLLWQQQGHGWYVRGGRFYAPYGLRLAEHLTYVRRDLGFDLLQETYNLSGGYVSDEWELHLTAFAPDFVRHLGSEEAGAAAYYERRTANQKGSFAVQARFADRPGISRLMGGVLGKYYLERARTLFLAEANLVDLIPDHAAAGAQLVGAAGASLLPVKGFLVTLLYERNQEDLRVRNAAWDAVTGLLGWFPAPHSEIQLMGRLQFPEGGAVAKTVLLQVHYFL